ncbi:MAG TPA: hypothetical protein VJS39_10455 [Gemmatimonadaceae bacterium]|nr:hypothetical protein [Gemmatimonadaceae bacterium]
MIPTRARALAILIATLFLTGSNKRKPVIYYDLGIDPSDASSIRVTIKIEGGTSRSVRLGMATHPEYDDRFWRYLTDWQVNGFDKRAILAIDKNNIWRVISHAGYAIVSYRISLPHEDSTNRAVWHTGLRGDGGSINPVDTFLYLADYPNAEIHVTLNLPTGHLFWGVPVESFSWGEQAMAIAPPSAVPPQTPSPPQRSPQFDPLDRPTAVNAMVTDIETLLDSPILYGKNLRQWTFQIDGVPHLIAYWPLPNATPFDTTAFVDAIQKVAHEAVAVFGKPPYPFYQFLLEDGAYGALEHKNSVTIGMPSRDLARDPRAYLFELAHEFFHAWNNVRLYPEGRGVLSVDPPEHSRGLWLTEGVTIYYAEALTRRAGFPDDNMSRKDLLARQLEIYYERPGNTRISPEVASARAVDTTGINGDYEPNYYVQGRLIGTALDLILRDSTRGAKGLDDFMRAMYDRFAMKRGFTTSDVERTANDVCKCNLHRFFDDHVRNARPLDFTPYLKTIGLTIKIDTIAGVDTAGKALPDTRIWVYPRRSDRRMRVWIQDPSGAWARAGLHTGQDLVAFNGVQVDSFPDWRRAIRTVVIGTDVPVDIVAGGKPQRITVHVPGFERPRVTITEDQSSSPAQIERRRQWEIAR